ncbi:MAG: hypothetical protein Edafosvirus63_1 [Edafosvirus sp.]|uniref:Uncharacterized protein n=1 Tax=Edafosvirus sp. TaxID=2487765 RepID=A0A3G4ZVN9_9VIRU|nr:MAG: hypothetical protein Edafosvirus63_1 [Edafosvirus sp.]
MSKNDESKVLIGIQTLTDMVNELKKLKEHNKLLLQELKKIKEKEDKEKKNKEKRFVFDDEYDFEKCSLCKEKVWHEDGRYQIGWGFVCSECISF